MDRAARPEKLSLPAPSDDEDGLERSFGLSLSSFPLLREALLREGQALRSELLEFAHALQYKRAPRVRRNLMARIHIGDGDVPEVAIMRDLSATGVRLWVDGCHSFDAANAQPYFIEVRIPGSRGYVGLQARLVRVAEHGRERGVELGFSFVDANGNSDLQHLLQMVESQPRESRAPLALGALEMETSTVRLETDQSSDDKQTG